MSKTNTILLALNVIIINVLLITQSNKVNWLEEKLSNTETKFCKVRKEKQDTIILECNK